MNRLVPKVLEELEYVEMAVLPGKKDILQNEMELLERVPRRNGHFARYFGVAGTQDLNVEDIGLSTRKLLDHLTK